MTDARSDAPDPWRDHVIALARLGVPLVGAQLAQMLIHATDVAMVGRLGAEAIGATALGSQFFFFVYMLGSGFMIAVSPLAAQAHGSGDRMGVRRAVRMGLWFAAGFSVLATVPMHFSRPVFLAFGQDPGISELAGTYMDAALWGLLPSLVFVAMRSFLSAIGLASVLLIATLGAVLVNAALNWVFIFGNLGMPALGVEGAAIASVGTNIMLAGAVAAFAARHRLSAPYEVFVRIWRADWPVMKALVALGTPISLTIIAEVGLFQAATLMAGWYGAVTLAAHSIVLQIASFAFMVPLGLASALTVRLGNETGRGRSADVRRAALTGMALATGFALAASAVFLAVPDFLISIFMAKDDPDFDSVLAAGKTLLLFAAAFQLFDGLQGTAAGSLRGIKDTRVPMIIAVSAYWGVGLPVAYGLAETAGLGATGIWAGLVAGLGVAALFLNLRLLARTA